MVWMSLELLKVVEASCLLHLDSEHIFSIRVQEIGLTASKDILDTLQSDSEHPHVFAFEHFSKGLNHAFADEDLELWWCGRGCAVAQSPHSFILNSNIVMLQNLDEFVHNSNIDTALNLVWSSGCDVRKDPARFFSDSLLLMS